MYDAGMEQWSTHPEHPNILVSDQGRVARLLKTDTPNKAGYARVNIKNRAGHNVVRFVHQLVLEAFVGPKPGGARLVRHLNDDGMDNRLENLSWGTHADNMADAYTNGGRQLKKVCPVGHPIEGKNVQGLRCKACNRARANAHWHGVPFTKELADQKFKEVMEI